MIYPVLAVTHSGCIRTLASRLVGDQLPPSVDQSPVGRDGAKSASLRVPNVSVTIIDLTIPIRDEDDDEDKGGGVDDFNDDDSATWTAAELKVLTYETPPTETVREKVVEEQEVVTK
jgi:hypothetical protein